MKLAAPSRGSRRDAGTVTAAGERFGSRVASPAKTGDNSALSVEMISREDALSQIPPKLLRHTPFGVGARVNACNELIPYLPTYVHQSGITDCFNRRLAQFARAENGAVWHGACRLRYGGLWLTLESSARQTASRIFRRVSRSLS